MRTYSHNYKEQSQKHRRSVSYTHLVVSKIVASQAHHKKIDGHAPELSGNDLNAYIAAGVYSDHDCSNFENALEKLRKGQFIMI